MYLNFTVDDIAEKVYRKHNTTKNNGDQIVIDATTLELGIRLCPERAKRLVKQHHISFVLYQLSDNGEGVATDSYHTHHEDIIEDFSEKLGETGCYLHWVNFDVTNTIQAWLVHQDSNHGIRAECKGCSEAGISMLKDTTKLQINDAYVIKAKYMPRFWKRKSNTPQKLASNERWHYRYKRNNDCKQQISNVPTRKGQKQRCCRQKMPVNVKDMTGFNFILQPVSFDAHFCQGGCPARYNPTNEHSLLQSLMHIRTRRRSKDDRIPRPSCTPKKLLPLEILHLDDEDNTKLRVAHWKNVIVAECGCS